MLARVCLCLLALACIQAGAMEYPGNDILNTLGENRIVAVTNFIGVENISITLDYMLSGVEVNSTKLKIDPFHEYVLIVVEKQNAEN